MQLSPLGLPCPGTEVVYQCSVPGNTVFWSFPGGEITLTLSSNEVLSGNFRAQPVGVVGGNFTSTLTFDAENGTVITCINGGDRSMSDSQAVTVQGICVKMEVFSLFQQLWRSWRTLILVQFIYTLKVEY